MNTTPSPSRPGRRAVLRTVLPGLAVDVLLPFVVYLVLSRTGTSELVALAWSALPPALNAGWQAWRTRRLSGVGVIVLASIAVGVAMALLAGDPRLAVARDAVPNVVIALALGGSLLLRRRPLVFVVVRAFGESYQPDLRARMERSWADNACFRQVMRRATAVGALVMLGEAGLRLLVADVLPVDVALPLVQVQSFVVWAGLVLLLRRSVVRAVRAAQPVSTSERSRSRSATTADASRSNSSPVTPSSLRSVNTTSAPAG